MALTKTVSLYIPTFENVVPSYMQDAEGSEETLQHSLVLTQPEVETPRTTKANKMNKKINYEAGVRTNRRILRNISKTFHQKEQPSSPKQQRPIRSLSHTVSQHEIQVDSQVKKHINVAALRAADKSPSSSRAVDLKNSLRSSNIGKSTLLRKSSVAGLRSSNPKVVERKSSTSEFKVTSQLAVSGNLRDSLRYTLHKSTTAVNKSNELPTDSVELKVSGYLRPTASSTLKASNPLRSPLNRKQSISIPSPALKQSTGASPTFRSSLKQSGGSPVFRSPLNRKQSLGIPSPVLKQSIGASPTFRRRSSIVGGSPTFRSPLARSANISGSPMRRPVPIGGSSDAINVLLFDFESQRKRAIRLNQMEQEIFNQELQKYEMMQAKKQKKVDDARVLADNLDRCEVQLLGLFSQLDAKQRVCAATEEELGAVTKEFEAELQAKQAEKSVGVTSAAIRMQQAAARRELKEQWKNAADPVGQARFRLLQAQEDIQHTNAEIHSMEKEIGRLKNLMSKQKSSEKRILDEQRLREHLAATGQKKEKGQYVRPKGVPKSNEKKAHVSRLEEEKAKRKTKLVVVKRNNVSKPTSSLKRSNSKGVIRM